MVVTTNGTATTTFSSGVSTFAGGIISQASSTFTGNLSIGTTTTATPLFAIDSGDQAILAQTSIYQPIWGSDDGLVLYLPFSEGMTSSSANIAYDRSPFGNDGTATNMPMPARNATSGESGWATTTAKCKVPGCVVFDGSNDYIDIPVTSSLTSPTQGTIEFLFNVASYLGGDDAILAFSDKDTDSTDVLRVAINPAFGGFIQIRTFLAGVTTQELRILDPDILTSTWYHVAFVSSGTAITIYLNGVSRTITIATGSNNGDWIGDISNIDTLNLGRVAEPTPADYFNGNVDEVRIYNRALSADEVRAHYLRGTNANGAILADKFRVIGTDNNVNLQINSSASSYFNTGYSFGIATTSPRYTLDVWGNFSVGTSTATTSNSIVPAFLVKTGSGPQVGIGTTTLSTNLLTVGTTTPNLVITNNGYVGIGTSTPSATLAVQGNLIGSGNLILYGTGN